MMNRLPLGRVAVVSSGGVVLPTNCDPVSPLSVAAAAQSRQARGQAIARAYEAARADAHRNLLEHVKGMRVEGGTTVQDMALESSEVRTQVEASILGASIVDEHLEDSGIAVVELELDLGRLSRLLGREVGDGITKIRQQGRGTSQEARTPAGSAASVGGSVTGSPFAWNREPEEQEEPEEQRNLNTVITVIGTAARDPSRARNEAQARLMAERAAIQDAYRRLLEYVYGVSVSSTTTVRDMVAQQDRLDTEVSGFVRGAKILDVVHDPNGETRVTATLELAPLTEIIR